jgi:hypothetical protein
MVMARVWEKDADDIVRLVLRRKEWQLLIEGIVGATVWGKPEDRYKAWDALEVLRHAEDDFDASALIAALRTIAGYTRGKKDSDSEIINGIATDALKPKETAKGKDT